MRHLLALISVLSVCCLTLPLAQGAPASYTVQPTPDFAFIGDSVTFQVSGIPLTYVFLIVHPAGQYNGSALADRFQQLDYRGLASVNVTIPADAESGEYVASVMVDGAEVANCSLSVLFDYETWSKMMITEMTGEIEAERNQTRMLRQELASLRGENQQMLMVAYLTIGFAGFTCVYVWVNRSVWRKFNWSVKDRSQGVEAELKKKFYGILNPPPYGNMYDLNPGQKEAVMDLISEVEGKKVPVEEAYIVIPSKTAGEGYRMYPVKDIELPPPPAGEKPAEAPVQAPEPVPVPAPAQAVKPAPTAKEEAKTERKWRPAKPVRQKTWKAEEPEDTAPLEVKPLAPGRFTLKSLLGRKKMEPMEEIESVPEPEPEPEPEPQPESKQESDVVPKPKPAPKRKAPAKKAPAKPRTTKPAKPKAEKPAEVAE